MDASSGKKIMLVIFDGLGDRPCKELSGKTPLEAAKTPNLDKLAQTGACGLINTVDVGVRPGSDIAHLSIFGYDLENDYPGRGPLEAFGAGFALKNGDVAFRANFGTVNERGVIIDRRAGRIDSVAELAKSISGREFRGVKVFVLPGIGHRGVVVLRGEGLGSNVSDGDPHKDGGKPEKIVPVGKNNLDAAQKTCAVLEEFLGFSHKTLNTHSLNQTRAKEKKPPANFILLRGAGAYKEMQSFQSKYHLTSACVAGGVLYKGIARMLGMKILEVKGATGKPDTNVSAKVSAAITALNTVDFVFLHIKGTDTMGEDGNAKGKKQFLEKADKAFVPLLKLKNTIIAVTGDHSTPCELKAHSGDAVPMLFWGEGIRTNAVKISKFGERPASQGIIGRITGRQLMSELINLAGRAPLMGD